MMLLTGTHKQAKFEVVQHAPNDYFQWRWGHYGAETESMSQCWQGIRRAASDWEKFPDGWGFSNQPMQHRIIQQHAGAKQP